MILSMAVNLQSLLGMNISEPTVLHTALRALVIYVTTLIIVRIGETRFLGKNTAFDIILGIMLGSLASRAINGTAEILPSIAAIIVLVALHWIISELSLRSDKIDHLIAGKAELLINKGEIETRSLVKNHITKSDLEEQLRLNGKTDSAGDIYKAYIERNGTVSFIPAAKSKVLEVNVKDGVQTVRIELTTG